MITSARVSPKERIGQSKIQAVLFDADGILYFRKNKDQELNPFITQYGNPNMVVPDSEINKLRHQAFIGQITFAQYKARVLNLHGITDPDLVTQGIQRAIAQKEKIQFFTGTYETLKTLKNRNIYLGIVTDTAQPLSKKIKKLERGGIGHLWDSITPSSEVGVQKPDPKIYQLALQQLGVSADQAIFVGHKSSELEGARNAGLITVAFNFDPDAKADFYLTNFSDLTKFTNFELIHDFIGDLSRKYKADRIV